VPKNRRPDEIIRLGGEFAVVLEAVASDIGRVGRREKFKWALIL